VQWRLPMRASGALSLAGADIHCMKLRI